MEWISDSANGSLAGFYYIQRKSLSCIYEKHDLLFLILRLGKETMLNYQGITIAWLGNNCFRIEKDIVIYVDPYELTEEPVKANLILITHNHFDHLSMDDLNRVVGPETVLLFPPACRDQLKDLKVREVQRDCSGAENSSRLGRGGSNTRIQHQQVPLARCPLPSKRHRRRLHPNHRRKADLPYGGQRPYPGDVSGQRSRRCTAAGEWNLRDDPGGGS